MYTETRTVALNIFLNSEDPDKALKHASQPAAEGIGPLPYLVAALSFMPALGVITGPIALIWGMAMLKRGGKPVAIIGAAGFLSQSLFFSFLFQKLFF